MTYEFVEIKPPKKMISDDNYRIIIDTITKISREFYSRMNEYLENIFNSPSTINRIMRYYAIGFDPSEPTKRYIMFGGTKIREYELILPKIEQLEELFE